MKKGQQIPSGAASAEWLILVSLQETHAALSSDWRLDFTESWASHVKETLMFASTDPL